MEHQENCSIPTKQETKKKLNKQKIGTKKIHVELMKLKILQFKRLKRKKIVIFHFQVAARKTVVEKLYRRAQIVNVLKYVLEQSCTFLL